MFLKERSETPSLVTLWLYMYGLRGDVGYEKGGAEVEEVHA